MVYTRKHKAMIERLRSLGIHDEQVLAAMRKVLRHDFVLPGSEIRAYEEAALPIGYNQTISHPYTVAIMSQTLQVKNGDRILEIGTGSGYQTAILCALGAQVFTVERIAVLSKKAQNILSQLGCHFVARVGDGTLGWQTYAPYDKIIITAGAPVNPDKLMVQLGENGKLLVPVGNAEKQVLTLYQKKGANTTVKALDMLSFVPLIGLDGWKNNEDKI